MIPSEFDYIRAGSVKEAVDLLSQKGPEAKVLAGGHSLLPAMKLRLNSPSAIIDIGSIPDLAYIKEEDGNLAIGAGTTHAAIASSSLITDNLPMISETASSIGDVQVRNKGTIGGSIAHADPAADWPAALLASEAKIVIAGTTDSRTVPVANFFHGLFATDLAENELITEIRIPIPAANTRSTYLKFVQPASRFAIVGCAAMVTITNDICENVRVAFAGVSATPFRDQSIEQALEGKTPDPETIEAATQNAALDVDILGDHFASQEYRQHLAKVFAKRALEVVTA